MARVAPVEAALLAEDRLDALVVAVGEEAEVRLADPVSPVAVPAGEGPRLLAHVTFGVAAARAEGEQLHQLAAVVLVRRVLRVLDAREEDQHRRVVGDVEQEVAERAERAAAEELVLLQHQPLGPNLAVRGREPVVPDERHPLDERPARPHHPVEPPEVVVAPGVGGREPVSLVVARRVADELLGTGMRERVDGGVEPLRRERARLAPAGAETGPPQQALGLDSAERTAVDREAHDERRRLRICGGRRPRRRILARVPPSEGPRYSLPGARACSSAVRAADS